MKSRVQTSIPEKGLLAIATGASEGSLYIVEENAVTITSCGNLVEGATTSVGLVAQRKREHVFVTDVLVSLPPVELMLRVQ